MRLHNFFIDQKIGDKKQIVVEGSELISQWRHVLRLNTGSQVVLFDNSGFEYTAQFVELTYLKAVFAILEKRKNKFAPKKEIFLYQSLIKSDKFEWILEKGTELGVSHFRPIISARSVAKKINLSRARKIMTESAEQSGRGILPDIAEPVSLDSALSALSSTSIPAVCLDPIGSTSDFSRYTLHATRLAIFLGPEGGFTETELSRFTEKNIPIVSLGSQILRAETAAVAIAAMMLI